MLIDWFTVSAQAINFLILVALLKRFLYGPVLRAMDRREERLASCFAEAENKRLEAQQLEENYRSLLQELEEARGVKLRQVEEEIEDQRHKLLAAARQEAAEIQSAWAASIRDERSSFFTELKKRVGSEMLNIARKSLGDLANIELEQLMVERFNERLAQLDRNEQQQVALAASERGVLVRSPFTLPPELRDRLTQGVRQALGEEIDMQYQDRADMPLGIELTVGGLKLSWGVDSYFEQLERDVATLYDAQAATVSEGSP
ncbi:ATP synthase N, B subunit [Syntrophotalea carbinolica DSM 2380]|uniref:ATP synthase subunit b 2 n=1 Tax=Syntrophotalea carbinolica (strain DSM 2380 / NBRC 103641 / GraBd1) TaxID=338963 RepID=ATPF2_SYNC1|nr:ATP synthase subunit b 2 [Syntrophotalea carbinolica]Q3A077.1 RecName: Full=ATP synthase subunit b 2; AltName: Full=ATP synthase F(0) sector subunit b 2; AltName: Full=ATPase subunit I 2; AltName: Full=F-type ATPase subunit b 2; Short=F-ATPase subunit b 2 [Syntrophotalea carbinolica DSM 2380]ABA90230.1 ATP synthase N, B subunit [Syntrophotalea carbinolica DSM 2380]